MLHTELSRPLPKVAKCILPKVKGFPQSFISCFLSLQDSNHTVFHNTILAALTGQQQNKGMLYPIAFLCVPNQCILSFLASLSSFYTYFHKYK